MSDLLTTFDWFSGKLSILQVSVNKLKKQVQESLSNYEITMSIMITIGVAVVTILMVIMVIMLGIWRIWQKKETSAAKKYRFRKRDIVLFFGRKMLRKMRSYTHNMINDADLGQVSHCTGRSMPAKMAEVLLLARKVLHLSKDPVQPKLLIKEPPKSFFEADVPALEKSDNMFTLYMQRIVRVFGHFEQPLFLELYKHMETKSVPAGSYLFKIGDQDDSIFIVQSGKINVYIKEGGGEFLVKEVTSGDSIHSLLSILDFLTGNRSHYKTVCARAVVDTIILKLPASAFQSLFERFPESLVRVVQVIMVRLQRVTFTALHNYLGLSSELINRSSTGVLCNSQSEPSFQSTYLHNVKDETILELARADLVQKLKLKDEKLLKGRIHLHHFRSGLTLIKQGSRDAMLIFLVSGRLTAVQHLNGDFSKEVKLFSAMPGEIVGALAVLTGEPSFFTIRSKTDAKVVTISKQDFDMILREQPTVVLNVAHTSLSQLTPFVRQIDFVLDWMMVEAGRALFRQGDNSETIYIVLTGRLRTVIMQSDGKMKLVGEYGRGELVGMVEVLTQQERVTTGMAVRDTQLANIPSGLLNVIKRKHPQVVTRLIHLLGQRMIGSLTSKDTLNISEILTRKENRSSVTNLATVAILPASYDVPLNNFTLELQNALQAIGPTTRFTSAFVKRWLGAGASGSVNEFRLFSWLGQQEDIHRMILYQCDYTMTRWTKMCIRQADCILIVGLAGNDPRIGELEKQMESIDVRAQKELVLLHTEDAETPRGTVEWLNARGWCSSHHHIRCPNRVFSKCSLSRMVALYEELHKTEPDRMSDVSRLARFLTGTSIGLVLGGGGARSLSQCGLIKAFLEAKIPIDMVGGTSIGAFMGALYCEESNFPRFIQRSREWCMKTTSVWHKILDLTCPVASVFTGSSFNHCIKNVFKDRQLEDLWIPFFCVTTDLTSSSMRVHTHGSVWRYVRASMSLAGYLPPLCDPLDGHLLLDGGYVNNLPADVMRSFGVQSIFAVDVGSLDSIELTNYGDQLSGWWLLWKKWNPWAESDTVPDMTDIQSRLAYLTCTRQLEIVKNSDYCEYIRPPIDQYGTLQLGVYDDIVDVGYNHGKTYLSDWEKGGLIKTLFKEKKQEEKKGEHARLDNETPSVSGLAHFADLAELVSRTDVPKSSRFYLKSDEAEDRGKEDEEGGDLLPELVSSPVSGPCFRSGALSSQKNVVLSDEKRAEYRNLFENLDEDGNKALSKEELKSFMFTIKQNVTDKEMEDIYRNLDKNADGRVNFDEFLRKAEGEMTKDSKAELLEAFRTFDKNGKGKLGTDELRNILVAFGGAGSDSDIQAFLEEIDKSNDGVILLEDLADLFMQD